MKTALIFVALLGAALLGASAQAAVKYTVTDLGTLGGTSNSACDVNNAGQVVGSSQIIPGEGTRHAFLYSDGTMRDLGTLGGEDSAAYAINDSGQVVGDAGGHAFLWQNGTMMPLDEGPASMNVYASYALGINRYGQIVGYASVKTGPISGRDIPVTWKNGTMVDLSGAFPGGCGIYPKATDINDLGQVVGFANDRGFLWRDGALTDLGLALGGGGTLTAPAINDVGQVVSYSYSEGGYQSFLWENGTTTSLALLPGGLGGSVAHDINNLGQIVGGGGFHCAVLWEDGAIWDLNDLIPDDSGWTLPNANAINDLGMVVGDGIINGNYHILLLTPVPEPATLSLLAVGGLMALRRRR